MYVCICNEITEKQVRKAVKQGSQSLTELTDKLGVAGCCGQCACEARSILSDEIDKQSQGLILPLVHVPAGV